MRAALPGLAVLLLAGSAGAAAAYGPEATPGEGVVAGLTAVFGQGNFLALILAGLWLGIVSGRACAIATLLAAAAAGILVGWAWPPPARLDVLIAGSGLVIALLLVAGRGRVGASAALPAALVVALFGLGLGGTLRIDAAPGGYVTAFVATFALTTAALVAAGVAAARLLGPRPGMARRVGLWAGTVSALLLALGLVPKTSPLDAGRLDLGVTATELDEPELRRLVEALLARVYLAFEAETEEEIFDALAAVTEGEVLTELYLQRRAALEGEATGGGRSELTGLVLDEMVELPATGGPGHRVHGAWEVTGRFGHWGHMHDRVNRYEAELELSPLDGEWRITGFDLRDMTRLAAPAP